MKEKESLAKHIPKFGISIAKYSGGQMIDRIGQDIMREVVVSILCGGNVRSLTEGLTQRRIFLSNAALLVSFLRASKDIKNFEKQISELASSELTTEKLSQEHKMYLQWFIGLTGKSIQNVLRSDHNELTQYLKELDNALSNAVTQTVEEFGEIVGQITVDKENYPLNLQAILRLFLAIGAQTLAVRGSEKSMYGKLFEKLILGSLLTIFGFKKIDPKISTESKKVFWLSERGDKRESDATLLIKPGRGLRFDIGFIGPGNTEISLDKVSRFEREMDFGRTQHFMSTIILIDRIGESSRITELAKRIEGNIVQMSMTHWVKEIAQILKISAGFEHPILKMNSESLVLFLKKEMQKIDLKQFA